MTVRELAAARATMTAYAAALADHDTVMDLEAWAHHADRLHRGLQSLVAASQRDDDRLAQIRLVLEAFDWETDDRQYALEQIDDILRGAR